MTVPFKDRVRALAGYGLRPPEPCEVKLDLNESPYDFPEDLKDEVWRRVRNRVYSRYPAYPPVELQAALSRHAGWPADGILVGNGSNELLMSILAATLDPGTPLLCPRPSFEVYRILGTLFSRDVRFFDLGPDLAYDAAALDAELDRLREGVVLLCSPNNPTGSVVPEELVRSALRGEDRLVLLDEAYVEFSDGSASGLLPQHERLVLLRTFSKAWGMAGMRVGYLLAHPGVAREIAKAVLPFNLNAFSETCALVALENAPRLGETVAAIRRDREALEASLARLPGVRVHRSQANFVLFDVPGDAASLREGLRRRGVLVRDFPRAPRLASSLRVTVGTPRENAAFLQALTAELAPSG